MNYVFYNPETMQNPGTTLEYIRVADMTDDFVRIGLRYKKPYANRNDALADNTACNVFFYENGTIYEATRVPSWQWKPCTDVECNSGINWNTYYAATEERLREYLTDIYGTIYNFKPRLGFHGLYNIQVHYDGRCR